MLGCMTTQPTVTSIRVDDVPLLIGLMIQMGLPQLYEREVDDHGHHQGLSGGWLLAVWLAFILSKGDHAKYRVQEWVNRHRAMLEALIGQPIRDTDFSDDRLGSVLKRLSHCARWEALETALWRDSIAVYDLSDSSPSLAVIRVDSTTAYGNHQIEEEGLMQRGHSKDHRPDLPQLKLMTAAEQRSGCLLASWVVSGNRADDPLYLPIIQRARAMLGSNGLLFVGDSKMAALATRAEIAWHQDYYLTVLPNTGETKEQMMGWVEEAVSDPSLTKPIVDGQRPLGIGYEFERENKAKIKVERRRRDVVWTERVQLIQSETLATQQREQLEKRLRAAETQLRALTPAAGRGKRCYREEAPLREAEQRLLERHHVVGLLQVTRRVEERQETRYVGRGRGGPNRPTMAVTHRRYFVADVQRQSAAIEQMRKRLGWRAQVTNAPVSKMSLDDAIVCYRNGWSGERNYHLLKDEPLGISPLFVRKEDQIIGLTHLLTLGVRLLSLIELRVRRGLNATGETIKGIYAGLPTHATARPTAIAILEMIARMEITLTQIVVEGKSFVHLTPLPPLLETILSYLHLPLSLYTSPIDNSVLTT